MGLRTGMSAGSGWGGRGVTSVDAAPRPSCRTVQSRAASQWATAVHTSASVSGLAMS
jgi:hypothetical protein